MTIGRRLALLVWPIFVLALLLVVVGKLVSVHDLAEVRQITAIDVLSSIEICLPVATFTGVGAFVVTRRPENRVGWLMMFIGLSFSIGNFTSDYPLIDQHTGREVRPLSTVIGWIVTWDWTAYLIGLLCLVLVFPTGTLLSRRWAPVARFGIGAWVLVGLLEAIARGPINAEVGNNPFGLVPVPGPLIVAIAGCGLAALAGAVLSLVVRFRTASGDVRQQIKWFTWGAALAMIFVISAFATNWSVTIIALLAVASLAAMPVFMGIAIMRYRLYEIDVLINRTLVYGSLTILLGAIYAGSVVALQSGFRTLSGQGSDLAIAISTLAIAALFQPLRRGLQAFIDRRFYRHKYDASLALATLSTRLRDDVDLRQLTSAISGTIQETMQPSHLSIWLRDRSEV